MKTKAVKQEKDEPLIQLPFRCNEDLRTRINRALGREMTRTGEKISLNEFMRRLVEGGLQNMEG
jgi:hypothetical protein